MTINFRSSFLCKPAARPFHLQACCTKDIFTTASIIDLPAILLCKVCHPQARPAKEVLDNALVVDRRIEYYILQKTDSVEQSAVIRFYKRSVPGRNSETATAVYCYIPALHALVVYQQSE